MAQADRNLLRAVVESQHRVESIGQQRHELPAVVGSFVDDLGRAGQSAEFGAVSCERFPNQNVTRID